MDGCVKNEWADAGFEEIVRAVGDCFCGDGMSAAILREGVLYAFDADFVWRFLGGRSELEMICRRIDDGDEPMWFAECDGKKCLAAGARLKTRYNDYGYVFWVLEDAEAGGEAGEVYLRLMEAVANQTLELAERIDADFARREQVYSTSGFARAVCQYN